MSSEACLENIASTIFFGSKKSFSIGLHGGQATPIPGLVGRGVGVNWPVVCSNEIQGSTGMRSGGTFRPASVRAPEDVLAFSLAPAPDPAPKNISFSPPCNMSRRQCLRVEAKCTGSDSSAGSDSLGFFGVFYPDSALLPLRFRLRLRKSSPPSRKMLQWLWLRLKACSDSGSGFVHLKRDRCRSHLHSHSLSSPSLLAFFSRELCSRAANQRASLTLIPFQIDCAAVLPPHHPPPSLPGGETTPDGAGANRK